MKKLTTTSYAILSLLALHPWTAYELSKQMRRAVGEYWPRAERGIYDEPKNLVEHGYAKATEERQGGRSRTVYAITAAGRRALRSWLADADPAPPQLESEAVLRIAFAEHGRPEDALRTLAALREQTRARSRFLTGVARSYVEGEGPYPDRIHTISLVIRFFADYYALLDRWAAWAGEEIEAWGDLSHPPADTGTGTDTDTGPMATLAEIAALRPTRT
jgi:DNA-binding PadR family transcriptional regulator